MHVAQKSTNPKHPRQPKHFCTVETKRTPEREYAFVIFNDVGKQKHKLKLKPRGSLCQKVGLMGILIAIWPSETERALG